VSVLLSVHLSATLGHDVVLFSVILRGFVGIVYTSLVSCQRVLIGPWDVDLLMLEPDEMGSARDLAISVLLPASSGLSVLAVCLAATTNANCFNTCCCVFVISDPPASVSKWLGTNVHNSLATPNHDHPVTPSTFPHPDKTCPLVS
jgi:hypothetical protein